MHKCPTEPCDDCWEQAKFVGKIILAFGIAALGAYLTGCMSIQTTDCKRDNSGMWRCERRQ